MLTVLLLMLTSQSPAVRRTTPASDDPGMVVRTVGTTTVNCTNCGGSSGGGWTPDGGNIGYMRMPDGGPLEVYTVNGGGSSGGGWVPDGGYVGSVSQGAGQDGGAWNVTNAPGAPLFVIVLDGGGSSVVVARGDKTNNLATSDNTNVATLPSIANTSAPTYTDGRVVALSSDTGGNLRVAASSLPLPTGAATSALQTTGNSSLSSIDGKTPALVGGRVPVDGSGVTQPVSGSVTVTQATGTNLHVVVDSAPTTTVTGTVTANAGTGPWPVTDNGGSLTVDGTVALSGTSAVNVAQVGGNAVNVGSGAAGTGTQRVILATDQSVIPVGDNGGSLTVDGTVTVSGMVDTELPTATTLADATANPSTTSVGALGLLFNGTTWDRMRGDTTNGLLVNVSDSFLLDATFTGRFAAGAALSDNFANPTTTSMGAMQMVWDGATWDRAPGNSTDGQLVNLGANNDVTVTGTVTANAGTGNFATNLAQYGGVAVSAANALHVQPGTGASFTVAQSTASNLRAQTASEGATGSAVPTSASLMGASDGTNLRALKVFDLDASATTPDWVLGTQLRVGAWGASLPVSYEQSAWGTIDITVYSDPKLSATPKTTAVVCATTATAAPGSLLSSRTTVTFVNNSAVTIYIGGSAVTTANGIPLLPGASFTDDVGAAPYYCRVTSGTADLRVLEN